MKHYKRADIWKASNVTFDANEPRAYSYNWWKFVAVINGKVVFNNYNYSPSTCKHQYKVRRLMSELGIEIDLVMECPLGLQDSLWLESSVMQYRGYIKDLEAQISKPRSRKATNERRAAEIEGYKQKIKEVKGLLYKSRLERLLKSA